jgi:serine/threonine-protein kinase
MPVSETARLIGQIAEALDFAHSEGVIHRDFKPSNVLLDKRENAYLADFGIAKVTEATAQLTGSGIVGTPAYMAPEMAERGGITPMIDIYALGVTLFQMLTGQLPYDAETPMGLLMAHMGKPIPDMLELRNDLPYEVQDIINCAMAKNPAERYPFACEMADDLAALAEGVDLAAPPVEVMPAPEPEVMPEPTPIPEPLYEPPPAPLAAEPTPPDVPTMDAYEPPLVAAAPPQPAPRRGFPIVPLVGGIAAIAIVAVIVLFAAGVIGGRGRGDVEQHVEPPVSEPVEEIVAEPTDTPAPSESPTEEPTPTQEPTQEPTETPEPTPEPTETPLPTEPPAPAPTTEPQITCPDNMNQGLPDGREDTSLSFCHVIYEYPDPSCGGNYEAACWARCLGEYGIDPFSAHCNSGSPDNWGGDGSWCACAWRVTDVGG